MTPVSCSRKLLLALVAVSLLLAQMLGLHQHRHVEAAGGRHVMTSELHFGDAGLHGDDFHQVTGADRDGMDAAVHHALEEQETSALGDALAKVFAKLFPLGLLLVLLFVVAARAIAFVARARGSEAPPLRHPFALHPPAQGPPRLHPQPA